MNGKTVSIIINNYNYARFLTDAIESALSQGDAVKEVLVVDDGSSDDSLKIIASFGDRIVPVLKSNGGQSSTFNAGFAASRGDFLIFLDADDLLLPVAVEQAVRCFDDEKIVKVHWPLLVINETGQRTGDRKPAHELPQGDMMQVLLEHGPEFPGWPPTSGNAWRRSFLEKVLPIPEVERQFQVGSASADWHLSMISPLFGSTAAVQQPLACYRVHGSNDHSCMNFEKRILRDFKLFEYRSQVLQEYCRQFNVAVDPNRWEHNSWSCKVYRAMQEIGQLVPTGQQFILVDDGILQVPASQQRRVIPFVERDGQFWGPPEDDRNAIAELDRLRAAGATLIAFTWLSFWWFEHYCEFYRHLNERFRCVARNERIVAFDLSSSTA